MEPRSPTLQVDSLPAEPPGKPTSLLKFTFYQWFIQHLNFVVQKDCSDFHMHKTELPLSFPKPHFHSLAFSGNGNSIFPISQTKNPAPVPSHNSNPIPCTGHSTTIHLVPSVDFTAICLDRAPIISGLNCCNCLLNVSLLLSVLTILFSKHLPAQSFKARWSHFFLQNSGSPIWEWNQSPPRSLTFTRLPLTHYSCSLVFPGTHPQCPQLWPLHWLFPLPPKLSWDSHMINCLSNFKWCSNVTLNKVYPILNFKLLPRHSWHHSFILPSPLHSIL